MYGTSRVSTAISVCHNLPVTCSDSPMGKALDCGSPMVVLGQLDTSDGILGFQIGNQRVTTTVRRVFESRSQIQILLIECSFHILSVTFF